MMGNKKLQVWLPLLFSLVLVVGMFFGYKLGSKNKNFFSSNKRSSLQEALDIIKTRYVDTVQSGDLEGKALQQIMNDLDPHSVYFPPVDLKKANEDLAGNFEGIGVEFNIFNDTVNIVYVIPGGPSEKAGLLIGDKVLKVNDSLLTFKGVNGDDVKKHTRGQANSTARLQILRNNKPLAINVSRGNIPVTSVDAAYMINKTTGYIKLNKFTDNSYEEFMTALEALKKTGMTALIYDLRGNGGGFMNEAVDMVDEFLDGDKLIVYTEGLNSKKREYRCKRPGLFEKGQLVVLVDELSASASEVLAGALQDWCRATIIGRRTFGKGLVQEQYPLQDGSALRLTIARYYTPLGRSIQRSYAKGKKVYMDDMWQRFNSGEMLSADSLKSHNSGKKFTNNCKDTLFGGDGITPTFFIPLDTSRTHQNILQVVNSEAVNKLIYQYYLQNRQQIEGYKSSQEFITQFNATTMWNNLQNMGTAAPILKSVNAKETALLQIRIKALLARYRWRNAGYFETLNADDAMIKKAVEVLSK
jgi:carboxyl-terminal processing protease